jgi:hypothetical protein
VRISRVANASVNSAAVTRRHAQTILSERVAQALEQQVDAIGMTTLDSKKVDSAGADSRESLRGGMPPPAVRDAAIETQSH